MLSDGRVLPGLLEPLLLPRFKSSLFFKYLIRPLLVALVNVCNSQPYCIYFRSLFSNLVYLVDSEAVGGALVNRSSHGRGGLLRGPSLSRLRRGGIRRRAADRLQNRKFPNLV